MLGLINQKMLPLMWMEVPLGKTTTLEEGLDDLVGLGRAAVGPADVS